MKKETYDIFISYRRETGADTAKHLRDVLTSKGYSVFFDTDSLRSGSFNDALIDVIKHCQDFILILSPNSLDRCINEGDWVRQEIAIALNSGKNIVPVMSSKFVFPDELPADINDVRWKNGVTVNIEYFDAMVEKLLSFLHSKPSKKNLIRWLIPVATILIAGIILLVLVVLPNKNGNTPKKQDSILSDSYVKQLTNEGQKALDDGDYLLALQRFQAAAEQGEAVAQCNLGYMYSNGLGVEQSDEKALEFYRLAADNGDITAIANIGYAYEKGLGVEQSYEKAIEYYERGVEKGSALAAFNLGYLYAEGTGVEQSYEKAAECYQIAADAGNDLAQSALGLLYSHGNGVEQSDTNAFKYFKLSADQGNNTSQLLVGQMYDEGRGTVQSYEKAFEYYKKAADQGLAQAQERTGYFYEQGIGTEQSYEKAATYYQMAADQGNDKSQYMVGCLYRDGLGKDQSYEKAAYYYQLAADQGYAAAMSDLAYFYAQGTGVDQSYEKAIYYFKMAADKGNASAQSNLGYMYYIGMGVEQSYEKAIEYYTLAAEQGNATALSNLGLMYSNGYGVEQSYEKAVELYTKAAEQGNAIALDNLGFMYENGHGVEKSIDKAIEYYQKAAEKGNKESLERAEILEKGKTANDNQETVQSGEQAGNNAYSFIQDKKVLDDIALSLFYVEMYDSDAVWLGTASGFVSFDEHLFVTNQHVIDSTSFLKIWDEKDNMYVLDKVIASDKLHDIAILQFPDGNKYTSLKQMETFNLQRGQPVVSIGSPKGFQGTVDDGVISSFPTMKQYGYLQVIQFSAAISAGSSGGALFDSEGNVIGITTSSIDDAQNLNFAIPITEVQKLYAQWDKKSYEKLGTKKSWDMTGYTGK